MDTPVAQADSPRTLLSVEAAAAQLSIGRTTMYALIGAGAIESVKVGRLRRVPADALVNYVARLGAGQRGNATRQSGYPDREKTADAG